MTQQYLRYCSVTADGVGSIDVSNLRCRFHITQATMQAPNLCQLMISNLSPQRAQQFVDKEFKHISIDAGYQDGHGIIFQGNIVFAISGRESPTDTLVTVWAEDGTEGHNYAIVNTTHPPGSTPQQHFDTALSSLAQYGITKGFIGVDLTTPTYPRAVTLFGMARDVLANIAKTKNASVSYQNEQVTMVPKGGSAPGGAIILNSSTGLIGMPSQTIGGIFARCLINPAIGIHSQVQINEGLIQKAQPSIASTDVGQNAPFGQSLVSPLATDGLYTVYRIEKNGDTRGNDWYFDLQCLATNQPAGAPPIPQSILNSPGASPGSPAYLGAG
jgi:hypothetical protein